MLEGHVGAVLSVLAQPAQVDRFLEAVLLGDGGVCEAGAAVGDGGGGSGGQAHLGRTGDRHPQGPDAVSGVGNGNAGAGEVVDGVGLDLLASRGQGVGGGAAAASRISRVGVVEGGLPRFPGWSGSAPR